MDNPQKIFEPFGRFSGMVDPEFAVNFLGVRSRLNVWFDKFRQPVAEARMQTPDLPGVNEEYFEWIDVLEAAQQATSQFTMIELGAGWGRWMMIAAAAVAKSSQVPVHLIGVEAEPTHYEWMVQHFRDNGYSPENHQLIHAAVAGEPGTVWFYSGASDRWYGQNITTQDAEIPAMMQELGDVQKIEVPAITLNSLLEPLPIVDLIDMDIQGTEEEVLTASRQLVDQKVKRVHVGTHSKEVEAGIRNLFADLGWRNIADYPCQSTAPTPVGDVEFGDGVQSWINPRLG